MNLKGEKSKAFDADPSRPRDSGVTSHSSNAQPPAYTEQDQPPNDIPPDLSSRLRNLNLSQPDKSYTPTGDQLVAHLKFLEAFWRLKDEVGKNDSLFNITPPAGTLGEDAAAKARVCEKRWAVYVARAVDRFETWWARCIPQTKGGYSCNKLMLDKMTTDKNIHLVATEGVQLVYLTRDQLPPLGMYTS